MRVSPLLILAILSTLPTSLHAAQEQHQAYTLVLQSADLPEADRKGILKSIDVSACPLWEVNEVVLQRVRDLGYVTAEVEEQKQASNNRTQLSENIKAGIRYRLRAIEVVKATIFPPDQLRREVRLNPGDVASASEVANGLERIRNLYGSKGYVNTVIVPMVHYDSQQGLLDMTLEVDEGRRYRFGELLLDGVEPYPGAARQLTASWKPLRGQTFNTSLLDKWLRANQTSCPSCTAQRNIAIPAQSFLASSNLLNVTLHLPARPLQ